MTHHRILPILALLLTTSAAAEDPFFVTDPEPLTPETIQLVIGVNRDGIQACYQDAVATEGYLGPLRLQADFDVLSDGRVEQVEIGPEEAPESLRSCVANAVQTWHFPEHSAEREHVSHTFQLEEQAKEEKKPLVLSGGLSIDTTPRELTPELVREVMGRNKAQIQACYEGALAQRPDLTGTLQLKLRIEPDGSVNRVELADDGVGSELLSACLTRAVSDWRFPRPNQKVTLQLPFGF